MSDFTVYKYQLAVTDEQQVKMPVGAKILCVQRQGAFFCIWATVNQTNETTRRRIFVRGTGHPLSGSEGAYIGTFQIDDGRLVFHVFDGGEVT